MEAPADLEWLAYKAESASPAFRIAAQWVLDRMGSAAAEASYSAPIGTRADRDGLPPRAANGYHGPE